MAWKFVPLGGALLHFPTRQQLLSIKPEVQRAVYKEKWRCAMWQHSEAADLEAPETHNFPGGTLTTPPAGAHLNAELLDKRLLALETQGGL